MVVGPDGAPAGFAIAVDLIDAFWLRELSVHPGHGRKGLGAALLAAFLGEGRRRGHRMAALTTFRDVAFNAPFYRRHGFMEADAPPPALVGMLREEAPAGVPLESRVLMVLDLTLR